MAALDITTLWSQFPADDDAKNTKLAKLVGGAIGDCITKENYETCCIRISRALNYTGNPVQGFESMANSGLATGKVRAKQGADKMWYIYSVYDLKV